MSNISGNQPIYNTQTGTPLYSYANNPMPQQQTVTVSSPNMSSIYQYPQTSVYNDPNKQAASGVNIYIYNPSAIGGPTSPIVQPQPAAVNAAPITNPVPSEQIKPPVSNNISTDRTKNIVELSDEYIKNLESYIRSNDENIRKNGIVDLIQRFEEDNSRYDDPALTALLNIALQDPSSSNRRLAMSVISGGNAHGDTKTIELLTNLQNSDKDFGQEAINANKALLKTGQSRLTVPDYSNPIRKDDDDKDPSDM